MITTTTPLIELEKEKKKSTWEAYQVLWTDTDHNKLPLILFWDNKGKGKEENKPQEDTTNKITSGWGSFYSTNTKSEPPYISLNCPSWELELHPIKTTGCKPIIIVNHTTMNATATQNNKTSETMNYVLLVANNCLTKECGTIFLVKKKHVTHCHQVISCLDSYPHDKDKIWQMANAKIEGTLPSKILKIKNNSSEPGNIVLIPNSDIFLDIETGPKEFYKYYQNLAPTKKKQEQ
ncbi:hypothetical protein G9A89_023798 [Geosiphon pyriformis]|nr:hypothetical protein G9A89_023798 [Geosiphon pyriformis]